MRTDGKPKVELLAPAGSRESLEAAVAAGADAVYMGGLRFGARAYADNPDEEGLLSAIDFVHLHGRRLYLTVNTLLKEKECKEELADWLAPAYEQGVDAVLVQDLGVMSVLKKNFPDLEIHISTQMAVGASWGARLAKEMGAARLVLPRELSLSEIRRIHQESDLELEAFIHGALCYCVSGQCLLSSVIGGRSGNRGRCAQPCRLPYNGSHLLNLKDLCTLDILPDLLEAGVTSLKIEGRMKGPRYTAGVVDVYRRALDRLLSEGREHYSASREDRELLAMLYDRGGGFTDGYYRRHNGPEMIFTGEKPPLRKMDEARLAVIDRTWLENPLQEPAEGTVRLAAGTPAAFCVSCRGVTVTREGQMVQKASARPLQAEEVEARFKKTGGTPFVLERISLQMEGDVFLPVGAMNALRREALAALEAALVNRSRRTAERAEEDRSENADRLKDSPYPTRRTEEAAEGGTLPDACAPEEGESPTVWASLEEPAMIPALLGVKGLTGLYLPADRLKPGTWRAAVEKIHAAGKKAVLALPFAFRREAADMLTLALPEWRDAAFDGCLIRSLDEVGFLRELPEGRTAFGTWIFDAGLYSWNREAAAQMRRLGGDILTLPYELRREELLERGLSGGQEMVVYGRLPLMVSAQCTAKTTQKCRRGREEGCEWRPGFRFLTDRKRADFLEDSRCRICQTHLYNSVPLWLLDQVPQEIRRVRFSFTDETPEAAVGLLKDFLAGKPVPPAKYTRGHFGRGVE